MSAIDFLISPYQGYNGFDIFIEAFAMCCGLLSVYFAKKENILVYPVGIVSTGIYVWICFGVKLYADAGINLYYVIMSIYGWYYWTRKSEKDLYTPIESSGKRLLTFTFAGFILLFLFILWILIQFTDSDIPYIDAFTTSIFFTAMWLMAKKKIEHWIWWIIGNTVSIPLYLYKGLGITSFQYFIFLLLAISGWRAWKTKIEKQ